MSRLVELFEDRVWVEKICRKLPYLFYLAEMEVFKGRTGMEAGTIREQVLIALLICKFGEENVNTRLEITEPEVDVKLFGFPISIKTARGWGFKVSWTVNQIRSREFAMAYAPRTDILYARINRGGKGGLYYVPLEVHREIFQSMGRENFLKLPKPGTNPRGVEIREEAVRKMCSDPRARSIEISWARSPITPKEVYRRWVELWKEE